MDLNYYISKGKLNYQHMKNSLISSMFMEDSIDTFVRIPILEATFNQTIKHINSGAPIMIISACHTLDDDEEHTQEEINMINTKNIDDSKALLNDLTNLDGYYIKVNGHWICYNKTIQKFVDNEEYSFIFSGFDTNGNIIDFEKFKDIGINLCRKYDQYAVLIGRKISDTEFDLNYYLQNGMIDKDNHYNNLRIDSGNTVSMLIKAYNDKLKELRNSKDVKPSDIDEFINQTYGSTEIINKRNKNRKLNLTFENRTTITAKNNYPYKYGVKLNTISKKD